MRTAHFRFGEPLTLRSDDSEEGSEDAAPVTRAEFEKMQSALFNQVKRQSAAIEKLSEKGSGFDLSDLNEQIEKLLGEEPKEPTAKEAEPVESQAEVTADPGIKAQLDRMQRNQDKLQKQLEAAQKESAEKEQRLIHERRKNAAKEVLGKLGAVKSEQAYKLFADSIIEDDTLGDAVEVETEAGTDLVSLQNYIQDYFYEENEHLFKRGGSRGGAGVGVESAGSPKSKIKPEDLRAPDEGGMSMDEYSKLSDSEKEALRQPVQR